MSDVPVDITAIILSRLPVKSLLRFRCVSKQWRALIDSPEFVKSHLNQSIQTNATRSIILRYCHLYSLDLNSLDRAVVLDHPLESDGEGTEVLGSSNGLLCLYNSEDEIVLWNPSTRKHHSLPVTEIAFPTTGFCRFMVYGFGHDAVSDDYKLVRIAQFYGKDGDSYDSEVRVFSLKSNSWKRVRDFPYNLRYKRAYGMFAGGALHWVVNRRQESDSANLVAAVDLVSEEYRLVEQPEYLDKNFHMNVEAFEGCLCLLCNYVGVRVDIWVMKEYGVKESWNKLFSVAQPFFNRRFDYVRPIIYSKSGGQVLLEQDNARLFWYDLEKKTAKNVKVRGMPVSVECYLCMGSLVPLSGNGESEWKKQKALKKMKRKMDRKKRDDFLSRGFKLVL